MARPKRDVTRGKDFAAAGSGAPWPTELADREVPGSRTGFVLHCQGSESPVHANFCLIPRAGVAPSQHGGIEITSGTPRSLSKLTSRGLNSTLPSQRRPSQRSRGEAIPSRSSLPFVKISSGNHTQAHFGKARQEKENILGEIYEKESRLWDVTLLPR